MKIDKENNLHISAMKSIKHEEDEQSPDGTVKWHAIERSRVKSNAFLHFQRRPIRQNRLLHERRVLSMDIMKKPEYCGEPKEMEEKAMKKIRSKARDSCNGRDCERAGERHKETKRERHQLL